MEMKCPECGETTTSRYVCSACGKAIFIQRPPANATPIGVPPADPLPPPMAPSFSLPPPPDAEEHTPRAPGMPFRHSPERPETDPTTQRIALDSGVPSEHFELERTSERHTDLPLPHAGPERAITDPEMELPAVEPSGSSKFVFTRVTQDTLPPVHPPEGHPGDGPLGNQDLLLSPNARETAALDASRRIQERRRSWIMRGMLLLFVGAMVGLYFVGMKIYNLRVRRAWMADTKISSQLSLVIAGTPSRESVETICTAIAQHGQQSVDDIKKADPKNKAKVVEEALGHWEALDDGRSYIASRTLPKDAVEPMKRCEEASQKVGDALEAFTSDKPPADTSALEAASTKLLSVVTGQEVSKLTKAPFERRTVSPEADSGPHFNRAPGSLAEARERTQALYETRLDQRLVLAIRDLHYTLTGNFTYEAGVKRDNGQWRISTDDGKEIGVVADDADFVDLTALLVRHAQSLFKLTESKLNSVPSSNGPVLLGQTLAAEMKAVNTAWPKNRDLAVATRAAHAAVSLAFQLKDSTHLGDIPAARAWALFAIARAYGGGFDSDEVLLAELLGYRGAALALSDRLGSLDAVHAYVTGDDEVLTRAAEARKATPGLRYLWARRVVETGSRSAVDLVSEFSADESDALQAFIALFAVRKGAEGDDDPAMLALRLLIRDIRRQAAADDKARAKISTPSEKELNGAFFETFDNALNKLSSPPNGAPFDHQLDNATNASRAATALDTIVDVRIFRKESKDAAGNLVKWLGRPSNVLRGYNDFVSSLSDRASDARHQGAAMWAATEGVDLKEGVSRFSMGRLSTTNEREELWGLDKEFSEKDATSAAAMNAVTQLAGSMDGRPEHLRVLLEHEPLLVDPILRERLTRRLAALQGGPVERVEAALHAGDLTVLQQVAQTPTYRLDLRLASMNRLLAAEKVTAEEAANQVHAMAEADQRPGSLAAIAAWLCEHDNAEKAADILETWLEAHASDKDSETRQVRRALAHAQRLDDRAKDAWDTIRPAMDSGSAETIYEGALTLLALDRKDELAKWTEKLQGMSSEASALYSAGLAWRTNAPKRAGEALEGHEKEAFWEEKVAPMLGDALQGHSPEEVTAAVNALAESANPSDLRALTRGLMHDKRFALAAAVIRKVPARSAADVARAYPVLEAGESAKEARTWLAEQTKSVKPWELAEEAYRLGADSLLVAMADTASDEQHSELIWVLKAVGAVRSKVKAGDDYANIHKHFEATKSAEPRFFEGRFLMGLSNEESLLPEGKVTRAQLTAAAFCRGVAAEGAGKIEDAALHYLDALKFQELKDQEGGWALQRLKTFRDAGKSLARIAAEGL